MAILVSLTPAESKKLIGKALAAHPLVLDAISNRNILISGGTTTAYFIRELLNIPMEVEKFPSGVATQGLLCQTPDDRIRSIFIQKGIIIENDFSVSDYDELDQFFSSLTGDDVYIKGANALDTDGNIGFLLAHPTGGSILAALHKICAQGIRFLVPVGLEKMIASVPNAQRHMKGINQYTHTFGRGCGYVSVNHAMVIHEITALEILTGANATHVGSGGVGGSEGAVHLVIEGNQQQERDAVSLLNEIKGEPSTKTWKKKCSDCLFKCKYRFPSSKGHKV